MFRNDPDLLQEMYDYCMQDVRADRDASLSMRQLNEDEIDDYHVNERINDRGVLIDRWWCEHAQEFADAETTEIVARLIEITDGGVTKKQGAGVTKWVLARLSDEAREFCVVYKKGEKKQSLDKSVRRNLLLKDDESTGFLGYIVKEVLELVDDAGKSSVAKYRRMAEMADPDDDRVRGAFMFAGAGQTGRYSSKGTQFHNMPRDTEKHPDDFLDRVGWYGTLPDADGSVMSQLSRMLRPTIIADDGKIFVCGDWDQVEARALPWLADDPRARRGVLADFIARDKDLSMPDVYEMAAARVFGVAPVDVTNEQRLIGKILILSCGFAGGSRALMSMAANFGVSMDEDRAEELKDMWRKANPWAVPLWNDLTTGFSRAFNHPCKPIRARRVIYQYEPDVFNTVFAQLPSGRTISYPNVRREVVDGRYGSQEEFTYLKGNLQPKKGDREWIRNRIWRGLLVENCLAGDSQVLTEEGWVPITKVGTRRVWDGKEWVAHEGLVWKGSRVTVNLWRLNLTPDHEVLHDNTWIPTGEAQRCGYYASDVRLPDGFTPRSHREEKTTLEGAVCLRQRESIGGGRIAEGPRTVMRMHDGQVDGGLTEFTRDEQAPSIRRVAEHVGSLPSAFASSVEAVRRARHYCVRTLAGVIRKFLGGHGGWLEKRLDAGAQRQRSWVLKRELCLGYVAGTEQKQTQLSESVYSMGATDGSGSERARGRERNHNIVPARCGVGHDHGGYAETGRAEPVYDLKNCGPRHRFVARGPDGPPIIVHNCTQAICADLLRDALRRLDSEDAPVVGDTHDEALLEVPESEVGVWTDRLWRVMLKGPQWADGLPLNASFWAGHRYRK